MWQQLRLAMTRGPTIPSMASVQRKTADGIGIFAFYVGCPGLVVTGWACQLGIQSTFQERNNWQSMGIFYIKVHGVLLRSLPQAVNVYGIVPLRQSMVDVLAYAQSVPPGKVPFQPISVKEDLIKCARSFLWGDKEKQLQEAHQSVEELTLQLAAEEKRVKDTEAKSTTRINQLQGENAELKSQLSKVQTDQLLNAVGKEMANFLRAASVVGVGAFVFCRCLGGASRFWHSRVRAKYRQVVRHIKDLGKKMKKRDEELKTCLEEHSGCKDELKKCIDTARLREEQLKKRDQQLQTSLKVQILCKNELKKCVENTRLMEEELKKRDEQLQTCLQDRASCKHELKKCLDDACLREEQLKKSDHQVETSLKEPTSRMASPKLGGQDSSGIQDPTITSQIFFFEFVFLRPLAKLVLVLLVAAQPLDDWDPPPRSPPPPPPSAWLVQLVLIILLVL